MIEMLDALTDATLAELVRKAGVSARPLEEGAGPEVSDGFGAGQGGTGSGSINRPTENVVVAHAGGRVVDQPGRPTQYTPDTWQGDLDPVGRVLAELFALLNEGHGVLLQMDRRRQVIRAIADDNSGRQSSLQGECGRCKRIVAGTQADKLVSGYCGACRKAWERAGYPDRAQFERAYQAEHSAEWDPSRHLGTDQFEQQRRRGA